MEKHYSQFFNLNLNPFGETPDAEFYFDSQTHGNALEKLKWAIQQGKGFTLLTGEVGSGKTLLARMLLQELGSEANTALVLFSKLNESELLQTICSEFELINVGLSSTKDYLDSLNCFLLEQSALGRRSVLIIDEAQNLPAETLETIRLLSNLETSREKLLQIVLVAQPELRARLAHLNLRQLSQRICVSIHLEPFSQIETERYVQHRLELAGAGNLVRFEPKAIKLIFERSGGVPRKINKLCELLLITAQSRKTRLISYKFAHDVLAPKTHSGHFLRKFWGGEVPDL